ncbi:MULTISPECIES: tetratricopeptide repeat protein [unclassified Meiothermus]|uniref:tetratricopeptide repeat protein n=1 Tax=unclassified Meiothermus TaxID=370471 RepID=UPI00102290F3|nr:MULTISPECIES: tetratricopeptide repeat protein [unclassified Meiothermus]RYM36221.1 tetratricopeptide repeat protein [Meiothermus sp. PNK-Is4]
MRSALLVIALSFGLAVAQQAAPSPSAQQLLQEAQALAQQARASGVAPSVDATPWKQAIQRAEAAAQADPQSAEAWKLLGMLYHDVKFWARAHDRFNQYLRLTGGQAEPEVAKAIGDTDLNLGYEAYNRGDIAQALEYFQAAADFLPGDPQPYEWIGRIYLEQGNATQARQAYQRANQIRPTPTNTYFLARSQDVATYGRAAVRAFTTGYNAYQTGDKATALSQFQAAVQAAPNWLEAKRWLARTQLETNQAQAALATWQQIVASPQATASDKYFLRVAQLSAQYGADAARAYFEGVQAYQAGDRLQALARFQAATQANPQFADAWYWLGRTAYEGKNYALAVQAYRQVVALQPDNAEAKYWLGQAQKAAR